MTPVPVQLLELALAYVANGRSRRTLRYCPLCGTKQRVAVGTDRCSQCVALAIDRALRDRQGQEAA
jgi:hypothetical protein